MYKHLFLFCTKYLKLSDKTKRNTGNYQEFVDNLTSNFSSFKLRPKIEWQDAALKCVDGLASEELRRLVNIETRRKYGMFFTNSGLAKKIFTELNPNFDSQSIIYDPACGAGSKLNNCCL